MNINLPDPITNFGRQFARKRNRRREEYVLDHHPGFNLACWRRILRTPARVDRWGARRGWPPDQILLAQALLISRMACVFIDHIIRRMEQADLLAAAPGAHGQEWDAQYRHFLLLFLHRTDIPDRRKIVQLMQRLHRYTVPPASLLDFRRRHWTRLDRTLQAFLHPAGAVQLFVRHQFATPGRPAVVARKICFTAAIYADIQERLHHLQWIYAYSDCMLRIFPQVHRFPGLLDAILARP